MLEKHVCELLGLLAGNRVVRLVWQIGPQMVKALHILLVIIALEV